MDRLVIAIADSQPTTWPDVAMAALFLAACVIMFWRL